MIPARLGIERMGDIGGEGSDELPRDRMERTGERGGESGREGGGLQ